MQYPKHDIALASVQRNHFVPESPTSGSARQLKNPHSTLSKEQLSAKHKLANHAELTTPAISPCDVTHGAFAHSNPHQPIVLVTGPQFDAQINGSRTARYYKLDPRSPRYDPTFPKPIKLTSTSIRFLQSEISAWIVARIEATRSIAK